MFHPGHGCHGKGKDRERTGCRTELYANRRKIKNMRLIDADERRNSDEKQKETQSPLGDEAQSGTCIRLLFTKESHNEEGKGVSGRQCTPFRRSTILEP